MGPFISSHRQDKIRRRGSALYQRLTPPCPPLLPYPAPTVPNPIRSETKGRAAVYHQETRPKPKSLVHPTTCITGSDADTASDPAPPPAAPVAALLPPAGGEAEAKAEAEAALKVTARTLKRI